DSDSAIDHLIDLASGEDRPLAAEALRSLRGAKLGSDAVAKLQLINKKNPGFAELILRVVYGEGGPPQQIQIPTGSDSAIVDQWLARLEGPADAAAGERIFFSARAGTCFNCHQVEGRGAPIGPDLTVTGQKLERRRLVESILFPSKEIAPQFVTYVIQ